MKEKNRHLNNVKVMLLINLKEELEDDLYEDFNQKVQFEPDIDKMTLKVTMNSSQVGNICFSQEIEIYVKKKATLSILSKFESENSSVIEMVI